MFNQQTVKFLKQVNKIGNSLTLRYPVTSARTESNDIAFRFDLKDFKEDEFSSEIGIYDLASLLGMFDLFGEEREVTVENNCIKFKNANFKADFLISADSTLTAFDFSDEQFSKTEGIPSICDFTLTESDLGKLIKAGSIMKDLDSIKISYDDSLKIALTSVSEFSASSNNFVIEKDSEASKNFAVSISLETLAKLPKSDYNVSVKYNETRGAYRILMKSIDLPGFMMILSVKVLS